MFRIHAKDVSQDFYIMLQWLIASENQQCIKVYKGLFLVCLVFGLWHELHIASDSAPYTFSIPEFKEKQ